MAYTEELEMALRAVLFNTKQHFDIHSPYLHWRDFCDALVKAEALLRPPSKYPMICDLCHHRIEDEEDACWWHGYGNCVDIPPEMMEMMEYPGEAEETYSTTTFGLLAGGQRDVV